MKIVISGISGEKEMLLSLGVQKLLIQAEIACDIEQKIGGGYA